MGNDPEVRLLKDSVPSRGRLCPNKVRIAYRDPKEFRRLTLGLIFQANQIIDLFEAQGYVLTLRQLYYQLVSKNIIENSEKEYKRLSKIMTDARYAVLISWKALEDRTREVRSLGHWDSPADIIQSAAATFQHDLWRDQENRVEVWVEKDALIGVLKPVCNRNDVAYFSCRGNTSASEMWVGAQRLIAHENDATLSDLVEQAIVNLRDESAWRSAKFQMEEQRELLSEVSDRWHSVVTYLNDSKKKDSEEDSEP